MGATSVQAAARKILVLGDSLSAGYGVPLDLGWVTLLQARLVEELVLERDPLCSYCRVAHFATLLGLGDYEAAEQQARLLLVTDPEVDLYAYPLGKALLLGGKAEEALDVFDTIGDVGFRLAGRTMADYSLGRESNSARQWAQLDARSPDTPGPYVSAQVAAWLAAAFNSWLRYDSKRKPLMRAELARIASRQGLSGNVSEIVGSALAMEGKRAAP